jgi:hypothetical protein
MKSELLDSLLKLGRKRRFKRDGMLRYRVRKRKFFGM